MAKITVCDICKAKGKLTITTRYMTVRGRKDLRIDYCPDCKNQIPKDMTEYTQFAYKLKGVNIDKKEAMHLSSVRG